MRIALVSTLATTVRRSGSGSIEGLVWLLGHELSRMGHEVTVFAAAGSETPGELVATLPGPYGQAGSPGDWQLCEWMTLCRAVEQSGRFDVIHSHNYLWGLPLRRLSLAPMVHTLHVCAGDDAARLRATAPDACVTALSRFQWSAYPDLKPAPVIHHGVDPAQFTFRPEPEDYVCYLGRFTPDKGPLAAIRAARELGLPLRLAGPMNEYYKNCLARHVDGRTVEYVGTVGAPERDRLLGGARALLYPVNGPEPFGLVMAEAMMCGTPVAAVRMGAVGEVVDEGITGFSTEPTGDYPATVRQALGLDRGEVHRTALARFSAPRMAAEYADLYRGQLAGSGAS